MLLILLKCDQALAKFFTGCICPIFSCNVKVMIFIDVTLKFRYKPIIRNDFINKQLEPKKVNETGKSLYAFLFCRVYVRYFAVLSVE